MSIVHDSTGLYIWLLLINFSHTKCLSIFKKEYKPPNFKSYYFNSKKIV